MGSNQIRDMILDYDCDQEMLYDYFNLDFYSTLSGVCSALYYLLKFYNKNKDLIFENFNENLMNDLIVLLEFIVEEELDKKKLKRVENELKYLMTKCSKYLDDSQKLLVGLQLNQINYIRDIINKKKQDALYDKIKIYENVIFNSKNLQRIEMILKFNLDILSYKDYSGENILYKILKKYSSLSEEDIDDINYLYQVILMFINTIGVDDNINFIDNSKYYLEALLDSEYKSHVKLIIDKFRDKEESIPISELESKYQVKIEFPSILLGELDSFKYDNKYRYDFTNQEVITIDNVGTMCRDDALYMEENKDGTYTLYMHKPNTANYIPYDSLINKEAQMREETLYLSDRVCTLFPEIISNNICSLLENVVRNTMTYIVLLDNNMNVIEDSLKIVRGKIIVKHKFSYDEADLILGNKPVTKLDYMLKNLAIFSLKQKNRTIKKEVYRRIENLVRENIYHESNHTDTSIAANIVHELSMLMNYLPAKMFRDLQLPYLYRIHGKPDDHTFNEEINKIITHDVSKMDHKDLEKIKRSLQESYLTAEYSSIPGRHYGLDKDVYSHTNGTSRLYSGTFVQYITESILINDDYSDKNIYLWESRCVELAKLLNERKQRNDAFSIQYNYNQYKKNIKTKKV